MYGVVLQDGVPFAAVELARRLKAQGVETRPFFLGMHRQPCLSTLGLFPSVEYPVADRLAERGLYLPSGLALRDQDIALVSDAVRNVLQ